MTEEPSNQLFRFLRASFRSVGEAHRTNPRRHASRPARLSWAEGERLRIVRGRLVDISRAGAALIVTAAPPLKARARLRLVGREPTPWLEADVVGVESEAPNRHKIRLKFIDPCPTYFLRVAVLGPVVPEPEPDAPCVQVAETHDTILQPPVPSSIGPWNGSPA
jgi:hypothetical protein